MDLGQLVALDRAAHFAHHRRIGLERLRQPEISIRIALQLHFARGYPGFPLSLIRTLTERAGSWLPATSVERYSTVWLPFWLSVNGAV